MRIWKQHINIMVKKFIDETHTNQYRRTDSAHVHILSYLQKILLSTESSSLSLGKRKMSIARNCRFIGRFPASLSVTSKFLNICICISGGWIIVVGAAWRMYSVSTLFRYMIRQGDWRSKARCGSGFSPTGIPSIEKSVVCSSRRPPPPHDYLFAHSKDL